MSAENEHLDVEELFNLGVRYAKGQGVKIDDSKALEYFFQAAEKGSSDALVEIGSIYQNQLDFPNAIKYLSQGAERGNADAMCNLGVIYACYQFDYPKAMYYLEQSAEKGCIGGIVNLGNMYREGRGVKQDFQKAKEYYLKAMEKGNADAFSLLGIINIQEKNYSEAKSNFEKAISLGCVTANINLGHMYRNGQGVKQNIQKAMELYQKALDVMNHNS